MQLMTIETDENRDVGFGLRYRYVDPLMEDEAPECRVFPVLRNTPKGAWIKAMGYEKFVLSGSGKRFAYPTKAEAIGSYITRKQHQIQRAAQTHDRATAWLSKAQSMNAKITIRAVD